ncbi:MAG: RNase adapter RapZ [Bacillota bacterium]
MSGQSPTVVMVTGVSGAGKSQALKTLEDLGFFCVDNLPPALIPTFIQLCTQLREPISKIAMGVDVRGREFFDDLSSALSTIEQAGSKAMVLFLEADDDILVRRYKETRRRHPLSLQGSVLEGIHEERAILSDLKGQASIIIDTSNLSTSELRKQLVEVFSSSVKLQKLLVTLVTFGFKHGLPMDADLVFDVRFLPNPYYVADLKPLSGLDSRVSQYLFKSSLTKSFFSRMSRFVDFLLPHYVEEGKSHLTIAVGCTGGRHRSVALGEALRTHLEAKEHTVVVEHRDIERGESGGQSN